MILWGLYLKSFSSQELPITFSCISSKWTARLFRTELLQTVVCWSWLILVCEKVLLNTQESCELVVKSLVAWNQRWCRSTFTMIIGQPCKSGYSHHHQRASFLAHISSAWHANLCLSLFWTKPECPWTWHAACLSVSLVLPHVHSIKGPSWPSSTLLSRNSTHVLYTVAKLVKSYHAMLFHASVAFTHVVSFTWNRFPTAFPWPNTYLNMKIQYKHAFH